MTIEKLMADYATYIDGSSLESGAAAHRIMMIMPDILDVLEIVATYRNSDMRGNEVLDLLDGLKSFDGFNR